MELGLKDKLIAIGGGAGSIGTVLCDILRSEGAEVIIADKKNGFDLSKPQKTKLFFNAYLSKLYGYVSLVYGGNGEKGILDSQPSDIAQELNGTLLAAVYPIQEAARLMAKNHGGHIVIVSSVNSILGLNEFAYDMAKGALNRVAPDIATSCGKFGVYAVTLCLGTVAETSSWKGKKSSLKKIAASVPDRKITTPEQAAWLIAFLLSDYARPFNGATLIADRGWHLRPFFKK